MTAEHHLSEGERLNQALNGHLSDVVTDIKGLLEKHRIQYMTGVAVDTFLYTLEDIHMSKFNPQDRLY